MNEKLKTYQALYRLHKATISAQDQQHIESLISLIQARLRYAKFLMGKLDALQQKL